MSMGNMAIARRSSAKAIILLGLALLSCVADGVSRGHLFKASARRSVTDTNRKVFDVTAFGAKTEDQMQGGKSTVVAGAKLDLPSLPGDDEKVDDEKMDSSEEEAGPGEAGPGESPSDDNASAFIKTWVAACRGNYSGPTKVLIPKGTFMTGPVIFQGPCTSSKEPILVEVEGYVKASTDLSLYASPEWFTFEMIDGLIVTGEGTFDGQGESTWKSSGCKDKSSCAQAPSSLKFNHVNNSLVEGITSLNSKFFHAHIFGCSNLTMNNVHITAPGDSPNTDGVHISTSTNVKVLNSVIGTGDDCVSIGQGSNDILVNNITCGPGHGISVGSLGKRIDDKSVSQIHVSNCTLRNTTNGARIKTWAAESAGEASDITYENIVMDQVQNPIVIDQNYGKKKSRSGTRPGGAASKWKISNVHFRNIRGTSSRNIAVSLQCSSSNPCDGIEMADINFSYLGAAVKGTSLTTECYNANIAPKGVQIPPLCR
ncbi:unnamed protein product [Prunus armeniaca]|uniref:Exopolygalacturonase-like n=1 Tax=Prunus armeniaca TaxID=36596 RepID=A0A6J5YF16_PRUAR|nr:unnamed protein product [Prunus armeniaca]